MCKVEYVRKGEKDMKLYKIDTNLDYKEYWCEDLEIIEEDIEDLQRQKVSQNLLNTISVISKKNGIMTIQ